MWRRVWWYGAADPSIEHSECFGLARNSGSTTANKGFYFYFCISCPITLSQIHLQFSIIPLLLAWTPWTIKLSAHFFICFLWYFLTLATTLFTAAACTSYMMGFVHQLFALNLLKGWFSEALLKCSNFYSLLRRIFLLNDAQHSWYGMV